MDEDKREFIPPVSISKFLEVLPVLYRTREVPVLVISHTGVGKTQTVRAFCTANGLEYKNIRLSYIEAQDIVGFPQVKDGKMIYIQPDFLPADTDGKGILFFDEINRARLDVLQAVFQLILERELGVGSCHGKNYKLPENWFVIASQNPDTDEYYVSPMDEALFNRFLIIPVEYDETIYKEFIDRSGDTYHKEISGFIKDERIQVSDKRIQDIEIHPTPRSFELFNKIFSKMLPGEYHLLPVIGNGLIGPENFKRFALYRSRNEITVKSMLSDILNGEFEKLEKRNTISQLQNEKFEIISSVIDRFISLYICDEESFRRVSQNTGLKYFIHFIFNLSGEQIVSALLGIRKALEKWGGGHVYLPTIEGLINANERAGDSYRKLIKTHRKIALDEYI